MSTTNRTITDDFGTQTDVLDLPPDTICQWAWNFNQGWTIRLSDMLSYIHSSTMYL